MPVFTIWRAELWGGGVPSPAVKGTTRGASALEKGGKHSSPSGWNQISLPFSKTMYGGIKRLNGGGKRENSREVPLPFGLIPEGSSVWRHRRKASPSQTV